MLQLLDSWTGLLTVIALSVASLIALVEMFSFFTPKLDLRGKVLLVLCYKPGLDSETA